ncbi:hypothetical protein GALMADRAFT_143511 [Galerina marginata CBS 339.88]|uniref:VWFA domain-containing protein n=1 Tax=Galerina marginata (strain CBS 339.88) TaxID=685588 RepID=A0A067SL75_GALM3|nr:hypothetical protein GALMADRAFT_143511 [Galerina marginata CBS 339.88]
MPNLPGYGFISYGTDGSPTYLPLVSVSAKVYILDVSARVILKQLYLNDRDNDRSSSSQYAFPVPAKGAVCAFKMQASGGQVVTGVVKERSKAMSEYEIAISNNQWAGLLYEATPDVFVISIGAIPRGQDIEVTIIYVVELSDGDLPGYDQVEFNLPTKIANRYGTAPAELTAPLSSSKGAIFDIVVDIQMTSEILSVSSPSHVIKVDAANWKGSKTSKYTSLVKLDSKARPSRLDSDFILAIHASKLGQPRCVAERRSTDRTIAMSLTFVPRFRLDPLPTQEYIFLIDRSSSMKHHDRIGYAKEALTLFLKSLPSEGTFFNVYSYGASYSSLWRSSRQYDASTVKTALNHVNSISADMGPGTEVKIGLENALRSRNPSIPTSLFLLTDGQAWNLDDIFSLVDREIVRGGNAASGSYLRIFTLGIGNAASTALCEGVARRGNGLCLMTSHSADISQKVSRLLLASTIPPLGNMGNIEIDWGYKPARGGGMAKKAAYDKGKVTSLFDEDCDPLGDMMARVQISLPDPPKVQQAPTKVPDLYPANRFTVFVILSDTTEVPRSITLHGTLPDGSELSLPPIKVHQATEGDHGFPPLIHTLAAHRLILELEDGDTSSQGSFDRTNEKLRDAVIKAAAVRFSETYQLASQFASFIAVDEGRNNQQNGISISNSRLEPHDELQDGLKGTSDDDWEDTVSDLDDDLGPFTPVEKSPHQDQGLIRESLLTESTMEVRGGGLEWASRQESTSISQRAFIPPASSAYSAVVPSAPAFRHVNEPTTPASRMSNKLASRPLSLLVTDAMKTASGSVLKDYSNVIVDLRKRESIEQSTPPPGNVIWAPVSVRTKKKATAPTTWKAGAPIVAAARLQDFDGSFKLDDKLSSLLGKQLSPVRLKSMMPSRIQGAREAEKVWATVLAAAYMKVCLADDKEVWIGLWQKAAAYVNSMLGSEISFAFLVDEACSFM